ELHPGTGTPVVAIASALGLVATTFVFAIVLFSIDSDNPLIALAAPEQVARAAPLQPVAAERQEQVARDGDTKLLAALRHLMEHDRVYREEGLSIGGLAARLGIAEYRLRQLINRGLGYRNFNAFLNRYRLDEVMMALADPGQDSVPILTVAL